MAGTELKIDDSYIEDMGSFLETRGTELQEGIESYLLILGKIREEAIKQGATAKALDTFITYASNLKSIVGELGATTKKTCDNFLTEVDEKDQYLFEKEGK